MLRLFGGFLEFIKRLLLTHNGFISRLEFVLQINSRNRLLNALGISLGQIQNVPNTGFDNVVGTKKLGNRLHLRG